MKQVSIDGLKQGNQTALSIGTTGSKYVCKPRHEIDTIDLKIIKCLSRDCRASYRDISSIVGITPNAIKERINKMGYNGIIQSFIVNVTPALFGYEKECFLTVTHSYRKQQKQQLTKCCHAFIPMDSNNPTRAILANLGINLKDQVYRNLERDIMSFLDITDMTSSNRNGIIILPIYWKKLTLDLTERLSYITKFGIDASLLPHCSVDVTSLKDDIVTGRITANNLEVNQDNEMMIYRVSLNSIVLEKDCIVRVEINFPDIEQNFQYYLRFEDITSKNMNQANQLAYVFKLFTNTSSNLPLYVNANNEKSQVIGTTWLLSILDFIHLNLGIIDNDDERDYDGKAEIGSVDTICFDTDIGILVIDFTTSPPQDSKITTGERHF